MYSSNFKATLLTADDVQQISDHSLAVSNSARKIALFENADQRTQDESFTAGLLHDAGKLILASTLGERYGKVLEHSAEGERRACMRRSANCSAAATPRWRPICLAYGDCRARSLKRLPGTTSLPEA